MTTPTQAPAAPEIKCIPCGHCDFSSGSRGMDRCGKCDGTGSVFVVGDQRFPNTLNGYQAALEADRARLSQEIETLKGERDQWEEAYRKLGRNQYEHPWTVNEAARLKTELAAAQEQIAAKDREIEHLRNYSTGDWAAQRDNDALTIQKYEWKDRAEELQKQIAAMREAAKDALASLVAATSLLELSPKKAAPSDKMFDQMIADYKASIERTRAALSTSPAGGGEPGTGQFDELVDRLHIELFKRLTHPPSRLTVVHALRACGFGALTTPQVPAPIHPRGTRYSIEHDGFTGTVIGHYERLDGKRGVVLQQDGTNVVHVYGEKWLKPAGAAPHLDVREG